VNSFSSMSVRELFERAGAIKHGHFAIKSGHHTSEFWEKALLLQSYEIRTEVVNRLAKIVASFRPTVICSPPVGGIILGAGVADKLRVRFVFIDKALDGLNMGRGYSFSVEERVAIVDDCVSSGATLVDMERILADHGLKCRGIGVVLDRRSGTPDGDTVSPECEVCALANVSEPMNYRPSTCPMCESMNELTISTLERPRVSKL
jgi:orotate phosphoribosyltransferase